MSGLGVQITEEAVIQRVLRTMPPRFDSKVSVLGDRIDFNKLTKDELHGILIAYKMRTEKENPSRKKAILNATKKKNVARTSRTRTYEMNRMKRKQTL